MGINGIADPREPRQKHGYVSSSDGDDTRANAKIKSNKNMAVKPTADCCTAHGQDITFTSTQTQTRDGDGEVLGWVREITFASTQTQTEMEMERYWGGCVRSHSLLTQNTWPLSYVQSASNASRKQLTAH